MTGTSAQPPRPVVGVGAVLLRPDGAVLIGHRIKQGEPASWCLPGGHVEAGESFEQAALRETAEESGITGAGGARVFAVALHTEGDRVHMTAGVLARVAAEDAVASVCEPEVLDRWVWARPEDLPAPLFPPSAALLAAWLNRPAPDGWALYPAAAQAAPEVPGRPGGPGAGR
ncbi:NUDIX domain-containing protein [Streptomyces sp. NPDC045431]|uniref:nucleotide triphosphate diphosphatase NUDT15 n=1 Tax=Streptomyces sp. NPDC045431 TaxID=3155613 RepID=UPI003410A342